MPQDATIEFVAKRSIKIDEPLCISYISTSLVGTQTRMPESIVRSNLNPVTLILFSGGRRRAGAKTTCSSATVSAAAASDASRNLLEAIATRFTGTEAVTASCSTHRQQRFFVFSTNILSGKTAKVRGVMCYVLIVYASKWPSASSAISQGRFCSFNLKMYCHTSLCASGPSKYFAAPGQTICTCRGISPHNIQWSCHALCTSDGFCSGFYSSSGW